MKTVTILILILFPVFVIHAQKQGKNSFSYETRLMQDTIAEAYFNHPVGDASVNIHIIYQNNVITAFTIRDKEDDELVGIFELKNLRKTKKENKIILMNISPIKLSMINKLMQVYIDPYFSAKEGGKIYINLNNEDELTWYLYKPAHASFDDFKLYQRAKEDAETDKAYEKSQISIIEVELNLFLSIKDKKIE